VNYHQRKGLIMPWLNPQVVFLVVVIVGIVFLIIKIIEQKYNQGPK
jgi:hypothetical protein